VKVFLDTNVWLSATVFAGLCEAIVLESHQRHRLLTTRLVQQEAHAVLRRKFPHISHAPALFDAVWSQAECVADVDEPAKDNDARLVRAAQAAGAAVFVTGDRRVLSWGLESVGMQILSPRQAWLLLSGQAQ
jgi:hypothetical protein